MVGPPIPQPSPAPATLRNPTRYVSTADGSCTPPSCPTTDLIRVIANPLMPARAHHRSTARTLILQAICRDHPDTRDQSPGVNIIASSLCAAEARIGGRQQTECGPVKIAPAACHHLDKTLMDEARGRHRHGFVFG